MHEAMGSCMMFEEVHEVMHEQKIIIYSVVEVVLCRCMHPMHAHGA